MNPTPYPAGLYRIQLRAPWTGFGRLDPTWMVGVYVAVLLIIPSWLVVGPLGAAGGPANMLAIGALAWWACARLLPAGMAWGFSPIRWAVVGFTAAMVAGFGAGGLRPMTGIEVGGGDRMLMAIVGFAGIALLAADGITTVEQLNRLVRRLVNITAAIAGAGILQFYTGMDVAGLIKIPGLSMAIVPTSDFELEQRAGLRRVLVTASHPIEFGVVLAIVLPLALHLAVTAGERGRRRQWFAFGLIAVALPMSLARSAILGATCALVMVWSGWAWPRKKRALKAIFVYAVLMRLLVDGLLGTIKGMFVNMFNDPSYTGRTMDYAQVGEMFGRRPWLGHGLGTFDPRIYFYLDNQYLMTLIETGLIGLLAMITLFLVGLFTARSVHRTCRPVGLTELGDLGRALAASMLVILTSFITFDAFGFRKVAGLLFVILGLIGAAWRIARVDTTSRRWLGPVPLVTAANPRIEVHSR